MFGKKGEGGFKAKGFREQVYREKNISATARQCDSKRQRKGKGEKTHAVEAGERYELQRRCGGVDDDMRKECDEVWSEWEGVGQERIVGNEKEGRRSGRV